MEGESGEAVNGFPLNRVVKIDPLIFGVIRIEGDSEKSTFAGKFLFSYFDRNGCDFFYFTTLRVDQLDGSGALDDENVSFRGHRDFHGVDKITSDSVDSEMFIGRNSRSDCEDAEKKEDRNKLHLRRMRRILV